MEPLVRFPHQRFRSRRLPVMIVALTLAVFGASIWVGTVLLRKNIRAQMVGRDADILHAVAIMHQIDQGGGASLGAELEETAIQLNVALKISELKGVIATRLYDAQGAFTLSFPAHVPEAPLRTGDLAKLKSLIPGSRFYPEASLAPYLITASEQTPKVAPLLEVNIPLHRQDDTKLLGVAQFVIDGQAIAAEFA